MGIDLKVNYHHLKIYSKFILDKKKRRYLKPERYEVLKDDVKKLIDNHFILESNYSKWVLNSVY